jgi:heme/copper-type cytochrome/quinol oxidase subunit 2
MSQLLKDYYSGTAAIGKFNAIIFLIVCVIIGICVLLVASYGTNKKENENTQSNKNDGFISSLAGIIIIAVGVLNYYSVSTNQALASKEGANIAKRIFD